MVRSDIFHRLWKSSVLLEIFAHILRFSSSHVPECVFKVVLQDRGMTRWGVRLLHGQQMLTTRVWLVISAAEGKETQLVMLSASFCGLIIDYWPCRFFLPTLSLHQKTKPVNTQRSSAHLSHPYTIKGGQQGIRNAAALILLTFWQYLSSLISIHFWNGPRFLSPDKYRKQLPTWRFWSILCRHRVRLGSSRLKQEQMFLPGFLGPSHCVLS